MEELALPEDPIVMYLIVRESLGMSCGKIAAQTAHASQMLLLFNQKLEALYDTSYGRCGEDIGNKVALFQKWLDSNYRKVVLRSSDKEWELVKSEFIDSMVVVVDAGLTQIPKDSETVIGLLPMYKSSASKTIKKFQTLK